MHGGLHAASEWVLAGIADLPVVVPGFEISGGVERANGNVGFGFLVGFFLGHDEES